MYGKLMLSSCYIVKTKFLLTRILTEKNYKVEHCFATAQAQTIDRM